MANDRGKFPGSTRAVRRRALLVIVALLSLTAFAAWKWRPRGTDPGQGGTVPPSEDPRLTFVTPYRNVRLEVRYVGQEVCAKCHPKHDASYRNHPMGRSLALVATAKPVERY